MLLFGKKCDDSFFAITSSFVEKSNVRFLAKVHRVALGDTICYEEFGIVKI